MPEKRHLPDDAAHQNGVKQPRSKDASPAPITNGSSSKPDISAQIAAAKARAEAVKARLAASRGGVPHPASSPSPAPPPQSPADAARARIEAMKARVAQATARAGATPTVHATRTESPKPTPSFSPPPPPEWEDTYTQARGGLSVGLHPSLIGDLGQDAKTKGKSAGAKFPTTMGNNRRTESPFQGKGKDREKVNPYLEQDTAVEGKGRDRKRKELIFNQKGKHIAQANALRRQAALEEMKKRIAAQAKKAGLDDDNEKAFLVPAPPEIEWWDEGLVDGKSYDDLENTAKYDTEDSIITVYVQHPVLMEPPQEKLAPAPRPMFMTKEEQAKLRRQRRMAEHKEQQAKIRLGLEPPPPPKVKKSNLMRVLGEQAVKDPTAVEARVNREIAERARIHEESNADRQLTREQRHEKLAEQQAKDLAKGVHVCVFKIDSLAYGKHRYQVDVNAKQHALTGICILNPRMNLIVVEGGAKSVAAYKKLLLSRIRWTENAPPQSETQKEAEAAWLKAMDEQGKLKDLSANKCLLVWEGEEREPRFRKWQSRVCETDSDAKDALSRSKMENMWTLAKSMQ